MHEAGYQEYRALALAIVRAAVEDACNGDELATYWLFTEGVKLLELCGWTITGERITAATSRTWKENRAIYRQSERNAVQR